MHQCDNAQEEYLAWKVVELRQRQQAAEDYYFALEEHQQPQQYYELEPYLSGGNFDIPKNAVKMVMGGHCIFGRLRSRPL